MQLYSTSYDPANCVYCLRDGKIVYKVACPPEKRPQTATIWRALPNVKATPEEVLWAEKHFGSIMSPYLSSQPLDDIDDDDLPRSSFTSQDEQLVSAWAGMPTLEEYHARSLETEGDAGLTNVAEIELHTISSTIIRHLGNEWKASECFRKEGWSWYGSDRVFQGMDGKEYKWKMRSTVSELYLLDGDPNEKHGKAHVPVLVARYASHTAQSQVPPMLEIFPAGEDMIDWILITFTYVELVRSGRRKQIGQIGARASI